jgi:hypothetical protein
MAFDGTYYKVYEIKRALIQRNNAGAIASTELKWANKLTPASETATYEWQGSNQKKKITLLIAQNWTLDLDALSLDAHAAIFGKAEITDAGAADALFDVSTMVGFGGGNDASGVSRGLYIVANALAGDTETVVELALWAPVCTVTLTQAMGLNSGGTADKTQYSFSATKTTVDITGTAIVGASADGEFFYIGEVT